MKQNILIQTNSFFNETLWTQNLKNLDLNKYNLYFKSSLKNIGDIIQKPITCFALTSQSDYLSNLTFIYSGISDIDYAGGIKNLYKIKIYSSKGLAKELIAQYVSNMAFSLTRGLKISFNNQRRRIWNQSQYFEEYSTNYRL